MINNATIMGRLTKAPELRTTNTGKTVTGFTVAVDNRFNDNTNFIDCVAWGRTGEFIEKWFTKGQMIALTGEIQTRNWEDKNGNKRKAVEVVVDTVSFCGDKKKESTVYDEEQPSYTIMPGDDEIDDDLPF